MSILHYLNNQEYAVPVYSYYKYKIKNALTYLTCSGKTLETFCATLVEKSWFRPEKQKA